MASLSPTSSYYASLHQCGYHMKFHVIILYIHHRNTIDSHPSEFMTHYTKMGVKALGLMGKDIVLHSIRSGGAMPVFLYIISNVIIQCIGWWLSKAFLKYICNQVENSTALLSHNMIKYEHYHNLNADITSKSPYPSLRKRTKEHNNKMSQIPSNYRCGS